MKNRFLWFWVGLAAGHAAQAAWGADPGGERHTYKTVEGRDLSLYVTTPDDWDPGDSRPAIVFFHGGGWTQGEPVQFTEHSKYFSSRGLVCVQVEYRLIDKTLGETPKKCMQDAKSAMRWVRSKAGELGIDPDRMASAGGSAGGHLAAFVGMMEGMDDPQDNLAVPARANAMLLFNPVFDNGPNGYGYAQIKDRYPEYSPFHNVSADDPPAIVFLGDQDTLIPVATATTFQKKMKAAGVDCEVMIFEGMEHGFFNYGRHGNEPYYETLVACDRFLAGLGWLEGEPTLNKAEVLTAGGEMAPSPEAVIAGFADRVNLVYRAEAGKPLVRAQKKPPLEPGRGNFVREYSFSIVAFAARCFYLNEQLDEANAALVENAQYYLDHEAAIADRDSFHWHADMVMRMIELYGPEGRHHPGRLTRETADFVLKPIWIYANRCHWPEKAEVENSKTWHLFSSENHHVMDFTVLWHFCKLAQDHPDYRDRHFMHGGGTPAEIYEAYNRYFLEYCRERARKGQNVEMMSDGYNTARNRGIYNFYDFGNPEVKRMAGMFLDLYFAYWAQEQVEGISGGGKARINFESGFSAYRTQGYAPVVWYYFGIGQQPPVNAFEINLVTSDYRPPAVVADIALDVKGRGRYEVRQRIQGLGKQGHTFPLFDKREEPPNKLRTDGGGILRYTFVDPALVMGTPMTLARPMDDWVWLSVQNRWQGVVFPDEHGARIIPIARPADNWRAMNAQWSVQSMGTLITQKLKYHDGAAEMMVWMTLEGLSEPLEEDGVVFVESATAYAAIRVPRGGYEWHIGPFVSETETGVRKTRPGRAMILKEEFAPVILEVMAKRDVQDFAAFQSLVKAREVVMDGPILKYLSIYGDELTFDTAFAHVPTVNGTPVDFAPPKVFESPFLNAEYDSGIVEIRKGDRRLVLDFN